MQSIEHTLRAFDKAAEDEQRQAERLEKTLTDYQAQANRPFEHEARLKELLARQAQLNAALDLDKSDAQAAEPVAPVMETAVALVRSRSAMTSPEPERNSTMVPRPQLVVGCRTVNCFPSETSADAKIHVREGDARRSIIFPL